MVFALPKSTIAARKHPVRRNVARVLAATALLAPLVLATAGTGHAGESDSGSGGDANGRTQNTGRAAGSTIAEHENFTSPQARMAAAPSGVAGIDVSNWQGNINWNAVAADGIEFAYIKATGGTGYTDSKFDANYIESYRAGVIRGAYHFARPNASNGATQANYFVSNGGDWSADGKTLPPMLDIEYNPSGDTCYGLSQSQMVNWIKDFSNRVEQLSGRYPVIYTTTNWWKTCTGNSGAFNDTNPLMIANWGSSPSPLPAWPYHSIWQYTSSGNVAGIAGDVDRDSFNGSYSQLQRFARCANESCSAAASAE